jgi:ribose/xylose/arabinose/galactoside ABC-type transport system permease subunit
VAAEPAQLSAPLNAGSRLSMAGLAARSGIVLIALVMFAVFALTSGVFATVSNMRNILEQVAVIGVVSIGETAVMLTGGIDLSVGSNVLLSSVVMADLDVNHGWPAGAAVAVGILAALMVGVLNGVISTAFGIEPIIVTLGTLLAAGGLGQLLLNSSWITLRSPAFSDVATVMPLGVPLMAWAMLALYLLAAVLLYRTTFGRTVYLIGGNRAAARLAGLAVRRRLVAVYALSGLLAGVAGYLEAGQLGIISQNDGTGMQFSAILAVLVGGLSVKTGGIGRVEKTLVGTLIAGMIANYFVLQGVPEPYEQAAIGFVILAAVLTDHGLRRREV